jgi:hypothetical protein
MKSQAQHCPFDGTSIIMLKIKGGKTISKITLREKENHKADSCSFAQGLLTLVFQPIDTLYARNHWVKDREVRYKVTPLSKKGDYYVTLNMAQVDCMIAKSNEYTLLKRHFVLSYREEKTGKTVELVVPNKKIYSLCSSYGSWDRIKAIRIK